MQAIRYKTGSLTTSTFLSKEYSPSPPNIADLNPLNYYVWSVVEKTSNKSMHPTWHPSKWPFSGILGKNREKVKRTVCVIIAEIT